MSSSAKIMVICPECQTRLKASPAATEEPRSCPKCNQRVQFRSAAGRRLQKKKAGSSPFIRYALPIVGVGLVTGLIYAFGGTSAPSSTLPNISQSSPTDGTPSAKAPQKQSSPVAVGQPANQPSPDAREPAASSSLVSQRATATGNWPEYRGPGRSGVSSDRNLPTEWSDKNNVDWKRELPGPGSSSPIVWGDHIYLTCYSGYGQSKENPGNQQNLKRHLVCLHRKDGRIIWSKESPSRARVADYSDFMHLHGYATSSPVADSSGVYVFYGSSGLLAYSHSGELRWQKSCGERSHSWGSGTSPIIYENLVIIQAEVESSAVYAFNKQNGQQVWKKEFQSGNQHTRATPLLVKGENDRLVLHSRMGTLSSLNPRTGELLGEVNGMNSYQNPSPITDGDTVYTSTYQKMVAVGLGGQKKWELGKGSEMCTPVVHDGHLYWTREGGIACCVNAQNGQIVYEKRLEPQSGNIYSSAVLGDGKIYYVSREKGTFVVAASPQFRLLAHNTIASDNSIFNATPAIHKGQLLIRSDRFLYCIGQPQQVTQTPTPAPAVPAEPVTRTLATKDVDLPVDTTPFASTIQPFLQKHCVGCHGEQQQEAGLRLDGMDVDFAKRNVAMRWTEIMDRMNAGEMPPKEKPRPSAEQLTRVIEWITAELRRREAAIQSTGGQVVMRRMNRAEYNNTIRDLIGIDFQPADEFPADPPAFGFDNIGAAQNVSPSQMEKYLAAA